MFSTTDQTVRTQTEHLSVGFDDILDPGAVDRSVVESVLSTAELNHGVGFQSGRAAIRAALVDAGVSADESVVVPAYSCYAVRDAVESVATPRYVDVDPETAMMDPDSVSRVVDDSTAAIIPVHLYGDACDVARIRDIADRHNLTVVEDACQALGTAVSCDRIGSRSDYCVFSFSYYKDVTTHTGGVLLSRTELSDPVERMPSQRVQLLSVAVADWVLSSIPGKIYEPLRSRVLDAIARGASEGVGETAPVQFSDWATALFKHQFDRLSERVTQRRQNAAVYDRQLPSELEPLRSSSAHSYSRYPVLVPGGYRDELCRELRRSGVGASVMYAYTLADRPGARRLADEVVNLPVHAGLGEEDIALISRIVADVVDRIGVRKEPE